MDGTGKDAAEDYPEEGGGAELGTHDGTADGTDACDVEKLDEVDAPGFHGYVVHAVGVGDSRSGTVGVDFDNAFDYLGIYQIPKY